MFITDGLFDKLLCCRRKEKTAPDDVSVGSNSDVMIMNHTNNNLSEYVTADQLKEVCKLQLR